MPNPAFRTLIDILLVEDNPAHVYIMQRALEQSRLRKTVHVAESGEQALSFLRRQPPYEQAPRPQLILLDLYLPEMSGLEFIAEVLDRQFGAGSHAVLHPRQQCINQAREVETGGAGIGDGCAVIDRPHPGPVQCGHAHRAWFASGRHDALVEEDLAPLAARAAQGLDLGMGRDVGGGPNRVVLDGQDPTSRSIGSRLRGEREGR